ncbi:TRAP transporter small permease subunit [Pseudooceanicola sp.]|uniref:TRAP transporter small permease subunit n=1 Tax=Pseudooceanicola sp. TaxID=1914328 RepID=UPI0026308985|nr:TRAP transporter small permease subunit [Pseudooceanicola sp.]MDF1855728.1 TRAP transporter small permease subunit [Pseudooceanicola sp.]
MSDQIVMRKPLGIVDRSALRVIDGLSNVLMVVGSVALMLMMIQVSADVVGKFVFNSPVPVTLEMVSNYYMLAVVFLPFAAVERVEGNIHVELIYAHLPRAVKRVLDIITYLLFSWLLWLLVTGTWKVALKKYKVGEYIMGSYSIAIWPTRFLIPIGCALLLALVLVKLVRAVVVLFRADLDDTDGPADGPVDPIAGTAI